MIKMIVVLCTDYDEAWTVYNRFVSFLERTEPQSITRKNDSALCVDTDGNFRYYFTDYHYAEIFGSINPDYVYADEFFNDIYSEGSIQNANNGRTRISRC